MRVWIDQRACVGNGICAEICPEVFEFDGVIAFVRDGERLLPDGPDGSLTLPSSLEQLTIDAANECPAACIYLEPD